MDDEFEISDGLRQELRDLAGRNRLEVPEEVDRTIRAAARGKGRLFLIPRVAVAAAAALLLAVGLWAAGGGFGGPDHDAGVVAGIGDVDGDGAVDVVDAYLLDRGLGSAPARGDVNGDGRVDAADVRRLMELVVAVGGKG